ncbi:MAG TPA: serine/threonine-protein kinase, partial [Kofleriaceae bacterium]|nr:serine/threonine-protein kinase [Kofleriaceae bacterium]
AGGGMGIVYRAEHVLLGRAAAIKVLRPELAGCPRAAARFQAEACATAAIRDPGVVEIYDFGVTEAGHAFLAMELLEGETLGSHVRNAGRLGVRDAIRLARQIAVALAAAHDRGIVHRDLKPENVFLVGARQGGAVAQVKLLDFGVAQRGDARACEAATGTVVGTPAYMAPEQCREATRCDRRADLYALGCILFELLTGAPPYGCALAAHQLLAAHVHAPVPDLERQARVPRDVARLVARLLAKRAEDRPGSARELIAELDRLLASADATTSGPRGPRGVAGKLASGLASLAAVAGPAAWRTRVRAWRARRFAPAAAAVLPGEAGSAGSPANAGGDPRVGAAAAACDALVTSGPTLPMLALATGPRRAPQPATLPDRPLAPAAPR